VIIRETLINDGRARHSERAIRLFSKALNCFVFDVRCLDDRSGGCTFSERGISIDAIARVIPKLRHRNANGSGVLVRPCLSFAFADDVSAGTLERMLDDNLRIAAVTETSPRSFQVWVPLAGSLQTIDEFVCAAACERLVELYGTDHGVAHRNSFGRAPGFSNRKPEHGDRDGTSPLVKMANRHCGFRGYDRTLLGEAYRLAVNHPKPLAERSVGPVLNGHDHTTSDDADEFLGPIEVLQGGNYVATFSAISTNHLFSRWLTEMQAAGCELPRRAGGSGTDRSQRDLDVLRSMHMAGVPHDTAEGALEAGSDKAQERGSSYTQHLMRAVWGEQ
jgi:hypothetical protein